MQPFLYFNKITLSCFKLTSLKCPIFLCVCVCVVADCLYFISKALEKDNCYTKGLVLKEKIFEEQPCLKRDTMQMFTKW